MSTVVADLIARLGLDTSKFKEGIQQAGTETSKLKQAVEQTGKPVESLGRSMGEAASGPAKALKEAFTGLGQEGAALAGRFSGLVVALGGIGTAIGAAALAATTSLRAFTALTEQVRDLSYLSGGTPRQVSGLIDVVDDLGVSAETVSLSMNRMSQAVATGDPALAKLGVSVRSTTGHLKDGLTMWYDTIDALHNMANEQERNRAAQEIFGRGWAAMIPVIERGAASLKSAAAASSLTISYDDINRAKEYRQTMADLSDAIEKIKLSGGRWIIGKVTSMIQSLLPAKEELDELEKIAERMSRLPTIDRSFGSDVGAWRIGRPGAEGSPAQKPQPYETEQLLAYQTTLLKLRSQMLTVMGPTNTEEERYAETLRVTDANLKTMLSSLSERIRLEKATINFQYEQGKLGTVGTDAALGQRSGLLSATTAAGEREKTNLITANQAKLVDLERAHRDALLAQQERYNKASISLIEILAREESNYTNLSLEQQRSAIAEGQRLFEMERRRKIEQVEKDTAELKAKFSWLPSSGEGDTGGGAVSGTDIAGAYKEAETRRTTDQQAALALRAQELGGVDSLALAQLELRLKNIGAEAKLVGGDFDTLTERINATRSAMQSMIQSGVDPADIRLQQLSASLKDLQQTAELRQSFRDLFGGIASAWSTSMQGIIQGTTTMSDAFKNMARSIALSISNVLVNGALKDLERSLENLIFSTGSSGSSGSSLATKAVGGIAGWIASLFGGSGGSGYGADYYASGGIVTKPTMAVLGEKGPELILNKTQFNSLPLDTQKDILDQLSASGGSTEAGASAISGAGKRSSLDDLNLFGEGGGGRGGPGSNAGGQYGGMTQAERGQLSGMMSSYGARAAGIGMSALGAGWGASLVGASVRGILGFDALRMNQVRGYASPTEADYQSMIDFGGWGADRAARTEAAINASLMADLNVPDIDAMGVAASAALGQTAIGGYNFGDLSYGGMPGMGGPSAAGPGGFGGYSGGDPGYGGMTGMGGSGGSDVGGATAGDSPGGPGADDGSGNSLAKGGFVTRRWQGMIGEAGPEVVLPKSMLKGLRIPKMGAGGMVTRPTLALLGESGPEAVIPLGRSRPAGNAMVQQVFNVSPGVPEAVRRELRAMMPEIRSNAVDAIMQARNRGGAVARSLGERGK